MILQNILNNCKWTPYGIECTNDAESMCVYRFLREAILDRHVYVSKVIGFKIKSQGTNKISTGNFIARDKEIGESYPEVVVNLSDKLLLYCNSETVTVTLNPGMNNIGMNPFVAEQKEISVLYTKPELCRSLNKDVILSMRIMYSCGYNTMAENSRHLEKDYYPCETNFALHDYIRILPYITPGAAIQIRYYNGMTVEIFRNILTKWLTHIIAGVVGEGEMKWLQNFEH